MAAVVFVVWKVRNDMLFNNVQIDPGLILHRSSSSFIRVLSNNEEIRDEDSKATTARVELPPVYESSLHAVLMTLEVARKERFFMLSSRF